MDNFASIWPDWLIGQWSAVNAAIHWGNMDGLRIVLDFMSNLPGEYIDSPQLLNSYHSILPVHQAAQANNVDALGMLVDYGADINAVDSDTNGCALHEAIESKAYSALCYLLENGADVSISNHPTGNGTPFMEAVTAGDMESIMIVSQYLTRLDRVPVGVESIFAHCTSMNTLASVLGNKFDLPYHARDKQTMIFDTMLNPELRMYILRNHLVAQFDIHDTAVPVLYLNQLMSYTPEMFHVLGKKTMQAMFPTEPDDCDSPLCIAAAQGLIGSCRIIISLGADLNFEGHALGSALMLACAKRQFKVVKFLVRAGAKITYFSTTSNEWKSAYSLAQHSQTILRWLLVEQYTEQVKIAYELDETSSPEDNIRPWSGITQVPLPLIGRRKQGDEESLFDYVVRLHRIKRALRGKVVYYRGSIYYDI
jgi:ankyrin repeat protein